MRWCRETWPRYRTGYAAIALVASGLVGSTSSAVAQEHGGPAHTHVPVTVDASLTWAMLLEHTLTHYPNFVELAARDAEARAWSERASRWFAARPDVYLTYVSDQQRSDVGLREYQAGLELTLWRPGERGAARQLGGAVDAEAQAASGLLRWQVTGLLRVALWDIASASNAFELAQEARDVAAELSRVVERRHANGDLALADTLLARSSLLEREAAVIDGEALVLDSERAYRSLTGLDRRPAAFAEPMTEREDFGDDHPVLAAASAALQRASASYDLVAREVRGNPVVAIGPRTQRDPLTDFFVDSVNVTVRVPFGGAKHGAPDVAAARRAVAGASADRANVLRELDLSLHEALHSLDVTEHALELALERTTIAEQNWRMGQTAFAQGEMSLLELLRVEDTRNSTRREAARLEIERQRLIAQVNQAVGELP